MARNIVKIYAVIFITLSLAGIALFLYLLFAYLHDLKIARQIHEGSLMGLGAMLFIMIFLSPSFIVVPTSVGLFKFNNLARRITLIFSCPFLFLWGMFFCAVQPGNFAVRFFGIFLMILPVVVAVSLLLPGVRNSFKYNKRA